LTGDLAWLARELATLRATPGRNATRFYLETLTTIFAFVDSKTNLAVVECGLGGRVRFYQCYRRQSARLTNLDLEYTAVLGTTHATIALQKVGVRLSWRIFQVLPRIVITRSYFLLYFV
jgi:folylpolyglutamate synthase/dihydropteroate synthase